MMSGRHNVGGNMDTIFKAPSTGYAVLLVIAIVLPATPAAGNATTVSQGICTSIREEHCAVEARKRAISIVKRDLNGKKYAKAVARLIGRPICKRIVNKFTYSSVGPLLNGWQMTLKDGGRNPLYSCNL
jgi:hypothetical protein